MDEDKITGLHNAAEKAGVSYITIRDWCFKYGIGTKVGYRWQIDVAKLDAVIKARQHLHVLREGA